MRYTLPPTCARAMCLDARWAALPRRTPWGQAQLRLQLTGDFNVYNVLAALTVGSAEGVALADCVRALEAIPGVRGRMERIELGQPFTVLVDYAHTPGAFEKLMSITAPAHRRPADRRLRQRRRTRP